MGYCPVFGPGSWWRSLCPPLAGAMVPSMWLAHTAVCLGHRNVPFVASRGVWH